MNSKQRAYLKGLAMNIDPIMQIGKASLTEENVFAVHRHDVVPDGCHRGGVDR